MKSTQSNTLLDRARRYCAAAEQCEDAVRQKLVTWGASPTESDAIVATLYSAWNDLLHRSQPFTDDDILNEVLNHWHDSKKRISSSRWQKALDWMRKNGFVPTLGNNN